MSKLDMFSTKRKPIKEVSTEKPSNKIPFDVTKSQRFMDDPCARPC